jgi:catechol 2,3-dioxygenase-like lactoylglutathione lyase family enzyme
MKLEGIHHVTAITADAQNDGFYARVLGLRLVRRPSTRTTPRSTTSSTPTRGSPGADIILQYPGARRGRAGATWCTRRLPRCGQRRALDFWADRLVAGNRGSARG